MNQLRTFGYAVYSLILCLLVFGGYIPLVQIADFGRFETVIEVPEPLDSFITEEEFQALYNQVAQDGIDDGEENGVPPEEATDGPSSEANDDEEREDPLKDTPTEDDSTQPSLPSSETESALKTTLTAAGNRNESVGNGSGDAGSSGIQGDNAPKRKAPKQSKKGASRDCSSKIKGVKKTGTNRYMIPAAVVDMYANDLKKADRLAVVAWAMKGGKKEGVRIKRIRCRSLLKDAGFKNGDVVLSVNNSPVDSYPKVLRAYLKLKREQNRLIVKVRRKGKIITLRYRLT